jgi:ribosome-associated toxin RatA of RatAB toxin-antitoxin module
VSPRGGEQFTQIKLNKIERGMRETRLLGILLFSAYMTMLSGAASGAVEGEWRLVRQEHGVEVYRRPFNDSEIPELRGRTHFNASVGNVYRVISDYDHFSDFIPMVSDSRVLKRDARAIWVYQRLGMPSPITDRHYVIKVVDDLHAAPTGIIDVTRWMDGARSMSLASDDAIIPDAFSGSWHLQDLASQGDCYAVYTIHVDPAGVLPGWLFASMSERYVIQVMNAVRKRIGINRE